MRIRDDGKRGRGFGLGGVLGGEYRGGKEGLLGMRDLFGFLKE